MSSILNIDAPAESRHGNSVVIREDLDEAEQRLITAINRKQRMIEYTLPNGAAIRFPTRRILSIEGKV